MLPVKVIALHLRVCGAQFPRVQEAVILFREVFSLHPTVSQTATPAFADGASPTAQTRDVPSARYRVLAVASHPVQYMSPIFRRMAKDARFDLHVAYCSLRGAEPGLDPEFGSTVQWDVPLLDGYNWTHVPNRGSGAESFWGLRNPGLRQLIRNGRFDAVLCYVGYVRASFWITYRAARASGAAFLFGTDATTLAARDGRRWKAKTKKYLWPRLFRLADQVIVPSNATGELMRSLGIPDDRITLTPFVVDNDWWNEQAARADRNATRASWGVPPGSVVVLFCAKLQPWKRPIDLLLAFARARPDRSVLIFAGEGPLRDRLQAAAAALRIEDRLRFLGFVNQCQLPSIYVSADVMVLPSEYEPFAVVVNESMCCGCPVIASHSVGAARDLIASVAPDFIFPTGDITALARILDSVASQPESLRNAGRAARERMRMWTPDRNIDATFEAVRRAVLSAFRGR